MTFSPPPPPPSSPMPPQYGSPYGEMPIRKTSGAAIASLILGILGCLVVTPFLAILLGLIGISNTKDPRYTGRGLAITGVILGFVWIGIFLAAGGGAYKFYVASRPAAQLAQQFTSDLASGNASSAASRCESAMPPETIQAAIDQMKNWGPLKDLLLPSRFVSKINGETRWELTGAAEFTTGGTKTATFTLRKQPDGSYKIIKFSIQ